MREPDATAPGYMVAMDADTGDELWRFQAGRHGVVAAPPRRRPLLRARGTASTRSTRRRAAALDVRDRRRGEGARPPCERDDLLRLLRRQGLRGSTRRRARTVVVGGPERARRGGNFYATAAVAYGRVFIGNTDGKVYAFGASSGDLLWAQSTGGFVYSSAAIYRQDRLRRLLRRQPVRARRGDGRRPLDVRNRGRISGAAPSSRESSTSRPSRSGHSRSTRDRRAGWSFPDGKYTPIVADAERAYLVGYTRVYGLVPSRP